MFAVRAVAAVASRLNPFARPVSNLDERTAEVAQVLKKEEPRYPKELAEGLLHLRAAREKRRALQKLKAFTYWDKLESIGVAVQGNRQTIERCFGSYLRGERPLSEDIITQIQDIQADERNIGLLKMKGQWNAAAGLKLQLERKIQYLENCELLHQIIRKKRLSKDEADAWQRKQTFQEQAPFIEDQINTGLKMDSVTEFVLGGDLSSLDGNQVVGFLMQNVSLGQQLVELYKAQIVAQVLKEWLRQEPKAGDTSAQLKGLQAEIVQLFPNWAQSIEELLQSDSAKKSKDEPTVQNFEGLKRAIETLQTKIGTSEPVTILEILEKDFRLLLPSYVQLGNKVNASTESWVKRKDAEKYNDIAIKIVQNPPKIVLLCQEFLKNLQQPEAQFAAAKALIQTKQLMVTAEVARNRAAADLQKK